MFISFGSKLIDILFHPGIISSLLPRRFQKALCACHCVKNSQTVVSRCVYFLCVGRGTGRGSLQRSASTRSPRDTLWSRCSSPNEHWRNPRLFHRDWRRTVMNWAHGISSVCPPSAECTRRSPVWIKRTEHDAGKGIDMGSARACVKTEVRAHVRSCLPLAVAYVFVKTAWRLSRPTWLITEGWQSRMLFCKCRL